MGRIGDPRKDHDFDILPELRGHVRYHSASAEHCFRDSGEVGSLNPKAPKPETPKPEDPHGGVTLGLFSREENGNYLFGFLSVQQLDVVHSARVADIPKRPISERLCESQPTQCLKVDGIWLWVYCTKIPIYPIFYLLKGDYIPNIYPVILWVQALRLHRHFRIQNANVLVLH